MTDPLVNEMTSQIVTEIESHGFKVTMRSTQAMNDGTQISVDAKHPVDGRSCWFAARVRDERYGKREPATILAAIRAEALRLLGKDPKAPM